MSTLRELEQYRYGWHDEDARYVNPLKKGLSEAVVREISQDYKHEPEWMLDRRLKALRHFTQRVLPTWGADLSGIDFDDIYYYLQAGAGSTEKWGDVPEYAKRTFDKLGIPEAERSFLAGVGLQYDSTVLYHSLQADLAAQGVIFVDTDTALREHEDLVREHFGTVVPANDNKLAALNTAAWSGGSFVWVPPGVHVAIPLQAYFRINGERAGQFERTLIIAEEGSSVTYFEGCSSPLFTSASLHSAVVEIIAKRGARVNYQTIQAWAPGPDGRGGVYNLVTKRAVAHEGATVRWTDINAGSTVTVKYPSVYLVGEGARGEVLSVAYAGSGQHQDTGAKMIHAARDTSSQIISKSISKGTGRTSYRGLVKVYPGCRGVRSSVRCDALILDPAARSDTYPTLEVDEQNVTIEHEATVSRIGEDQMFYLRSRGLSEQEAVGMIVNGFMEPVVRELPVDYALEMNRLVTLKISGAIG